jgi:hypothetical protein
MTVIYPRIDHNKKGKPINKHLSQMIDARYMTLIININQVYLLDEVFASRKAALLRYMNFDYRTRNRFSHKHQFVIERAIVEQENSTFQMWLKATPNHSRNGTQTKELNWNYPLPVKFFTHDNQLNPLKETAQ